MKYTLDSNCKTIAGMRRKIVKFLFTLMTAFSFTPSFAEEGEYDYTAPSANTVYTEYDGNNKFKPGKAGEEVPGDFYYKIVDTDEDYSTSAPVIIVPGEYTVSWYFKPTDEEKEATEPEDLAVKVDKRGIQIEWTETEKIYTGEPLLPTPIISSKKLPVSEDELTLKVESENPCIDVKKDYTATAELEGEDSNKYKIISGETTSFDITPATPVEGVDFTAPTSKDVKDLVYTGSDIVLINEPEYTAPYSGTMLYSVDGGEFDMTIPAKTDVKKYTIKYKTSASKNYLASEEGELTVTIAPKPLDLSWTKTSKEFNGDAQLPEVDLKDKGDVIGEEEVFPIITTEGKTAVKCDYTIEAVLDGANKANYKIGTGASTKFCITKAKPTVTLPTAVTGLVETEGSELTLINNDAVCDGGTLEYSLDNESFDTALPKGTEAGNYTVYFRVVGDENHKDSTLKSTVKVTITKNLVLTMSREGWTYGSDASDFDGVSGNVGNGEVKYTYYTDEACKTKTTTSDGATAKGEEPTKAGIYYIVADVDAIGYYNAGTAKTSFEISKKKVNFEWSDETDLTYNGSEQAPKYTFNGTLENDDVTENVIGKRKDVGGIYTASFELGGTDARNYEIVGTTTTTFTISASSVNDFEKPVAVEKLVYTGSPLKLVKAGKKGTTDGKFKYSLGEEGDFTDTIPAVIDASEEYKVGFKFIPTDENINPSEAEYISVKVAKANVKVTLPTPIEGLKETGAPVTLINDDATCVGGVLYYRVDEKGYYTDLPQETEPGKYTISFKVKGDNNHKDSILSETLSVSVALVIKELNLTMSRAGWIYGDEPSTFSGVSGNLGEGDVTYAYYTDAECKKKTTETNGATKKGDEPSKPGTYYITAHVAAAGKYAEGFDTTSFTISKKTLLITWGNTQLEYNEQLQKPAYTFTGKVGEDDVTVVVSGDKKEVGNNHMAIASLDGNDKDYYQLTSANASKEFSISAAKIEKPTFTKTDYTWDGTTIPFVEESTKYIITGSASAKEPNEYPVSIVPNDGYVWSDGSSDAVEETFVIKKISVNIPDPDTKTFQYNGKTQTYTVAKNSAYTISGNKQSKADTHVVTISLNDKDHYEWSNKKTEDITYDFIISKSFVKLPKVDSVLTYIYDGKEKNFGITVAAGSLLADSNAVGTEVGKYIRTVALDMDEAGGYVWEGTEASIEPQIFTFEIKPQPVIIPEVKETDFIYNGKPFTFVIPKDTASTPRYEIIKSTDSEVGPGIYRDTVRLLDKKNYVWADNTIKDREIIFKIGSGKIDEPLINKTFPYTGEPITFVPSNSAYVVENGSGTDAGTYTVVVTPSANYTWQNGTKTPYKVDVKIIEKPIDKPVVNGTSFTYNGDEKFRIPSSDYYQISGDTFGVEPKKYKATVSLKPNYMWKDSTKAPLVFNIEIKRIVVDAPLADSTEFVYNGSEQTYKIAASSIYKVANNKHTKAGNYTVKVSFDSLHYVWSDNTDVTRTYKFTISRAKVAAPVAIKSQFIYDGTDKNFEIASNDNYVIKSENASAKKVGTYERTVSLADSTNYTWSDGTTADKTVTFEIQTCAVEYPTVVEESNYTGSPIEFVEKNPAYTVKNRVGTDANSYDVTVTLNPGYVWIGGSTEVKTYTAVINPKYVAKPEVEDATYTYSGETYSFGFIPSAGYSFVGDTAAKEPGTYDVKVKLNKNYIWNDDKTDDMEYTFVINKNDVAIPVANTSKFVYNGNEQTYTVVIPEDSLFEVSNNIQINAGKYPVKISLKDSAHYQWIDSTTADKSFDFVISKAKVALPTTPLSNFIYDKTEKEFKVDLNPLYEVADSNAVATKAGRYERTASLVDTANYTWADETVEVKKIVFVIGNGTIEVPDVKLEYTYTGDTIIFVPLDGSYTVANRMKKEVGTYKVVLTPTSGYRLPNGHADTTFMVVIKPIMVEKPQLQTEYTYNKKTIDFKVPVNEAYEITGETSGMELGKYKVTLDLLPNYMWTDSTLANASYTFSINKKLIPIPAKDSTVFVYNGKYQTYSIAKSSDYKVLDNVKVYAGSYEVPVLLTDFTHSTWEDQTTEIKTYNFNIARAKVELPKAVQPSFSYDATVKYLNVVENSRYEVLSKNATAIGVGTYERIVTLKDSLNYTWSDGTVSDKTVTFTIVNGAIEHPEVATEYVYTGKQISFVPENSAYIVENGKQTEAGTYEVIVTLKAGYIWDDNTVLADTHTVVIKPRVIEKPVFPTTSVYTYNDTIHGVVIPDADGYSVDGITQTKEPGTYKVTVALKPNYIWSDKSESPLNYTYKINRIVVDVPEKIDTTFKFTGSEITYPIIDTVDYYTVSGHHRTSAGSHYVTISLSDSLHYIWSDSTIAPKYYEFLISKLVVDYPVAKVDSFTFDGDDKSFDIVANENYIIDRNNASAADTGIYMRKVSLADTVNFIWPDGTIEDKFVTFYILNGLIPSITVPTDIVYSGDTLNLLPENSAYVLTNNRVVNAGTYKVKATPKSGYVWASDSTTKTKTFTVKVSRKSVMIPEGDTTVFTYNKKSQTYSIYIPEDFVYSVSGNIHTNAGKYDVFVSLNDTSNYCWSDKTIDTVLYSFVIARQKVSIPKNNQGTFLYNSKPQTFKIAIPKDSLFTISGNVQTEVGKYEVLATLKDTSNYCWSDKTTAAKSYTFIIEDCDLRIDPIDQSIDLVSETTPGNYARFDVNVTKGSVYKYWVICDSCPSLNVDTTFINGTISSIDVYVPESIKPGRYKIKISMMAGKYVKTQVVDMVVNYPASNIYVVWDDVLTIDNSLGLFETYQWYKDGEEIPGATMQYYQEKNGLDGYYSCLVNGEMYVGPAFFHVNKPLWIKATGGKGVIDVEVIGDIPAGTQVGVYSVSSSTKKLQDAERTMSFNLSSGVYIVKFVNPDSNISNQAVKVVVR